MKKLMFSLFHISCGLLCILVMIFSFVVFFTLIYYTKKYSRINLLIICKYLFIFFIHLVLFFFSINNHLNINYSYSTKVISSFNLCFIFLLQFAINIEYYIDLRNPLYILKSIFNNDFKTFFFIFLILIISISIAFCPYFFQENIQSICDYILETNEENYFDVSFKENMLLSPIIFLGFAYLVYIFFQMRRFYRNLKEKSLEHLKYTNESLLMMNSLYVFFIIKIMILKISFPSDYFSQLIHLCFIIILIFDSYLSIFRIFHSGLYYYYLNKTFIGCIYNILLFGYCCRDSAYKKTVDLIISKHTESIYNFYNFENYIIEDYVLDTLDFMLHSITTGLSIVYEDFRKQTYYFQSKLDFLPLEKEKIDNNLEISNNSIINTFNSRIIEDEEKEEKEENDNSELVEDESTSNVNSLYNFFKVCSKSYIGDKENNDLFSFKNCGDANIKINPIFVKESIESMNLFEITKYEIIKSLLSHKFLSLLMTNSKRIFFKNINNLIISTYDSKLLIELHSDISITSNFNSKIKKYFKYMNYGYFNSFLCILIGIFRIKINNFKEIIIFVSRNPLIEKIPQDYYNYWEILRFNIKTKKFNKMVSSKDNDSFIINQKNDDSIISPNNNHCLFHLDDFQIFKDAIKNDINFLKTISSDDFCLVVLHYEFEIKNMKKNTLFIDNKAKFNDYPLSFLRSYGMKNFSENILKNKKFILSLPNNSNNQKKHDITNINEVSEELLDEEISIDADMKNKIDDISYIQNCSANSKSMIMFNGFDASFNNYRGLVYFRWDNIFIQKNCCFCDKNYYSNYINDVMQFFSN